MTQHHRLHNLASRSIGLLLALTSIASLPSASATAEPLPVESTRDWAILADGRAKPLLTYANETVLAVTGRKSMDGLSALDIVWGYVFTGKEFGRREYIRVDSPELKRHLGLDPDEKRFSFDALMANAAFQQLGTKAVERQSAEQTLSSLEEDAVALYVKLVRVSSLMQSDALTLVPPSDEGGAWLSPKQLQGSPDPKAKAVFAGFGKLARSYREGDAGGFREAAQSVGAALRDLSPGLYPPANTIERELFYEGFGPFGKAWKLYLGAFLLLLLFGHRNNRWVYAGGVLLLTAGFACHSLGIGLRWSIAGRAPVSNMYESLIFMGWGVIVLALIQELINRNRVFAIAGSLMGFLCLAFSENLPIDSNINPLLPVLAHTSWLAIHVMTIMLSYSAMTLAMALGHYSLYVQWRDPENSERATLCSILLYKMLQVGVLFLGAGIIFGAVWANESWGRYWAWDPKETWSLITFFVYLAIIHARHAGWLYHFGLAASSILGFLSVIMTYYGVNFILAAGMHSYGFAEGGQLYALAFALVEIGIIVAALVLRRQRALTSIEASA